MDRKAIGRSGRTMSAIALGSSPFGREIDDDDTLRVLDYAVEKGITFLDLAEGPQRGSTEYVVGRWMKEHGNRDDLTICTKISQGGGGAVNIRRALAGSLDRLQTDRLDVYKMHSPDPSTPIEETLGALTEEIDAGRIGVIGGSNYKAAQLREVLESAARHGTARFEITQPPYGLSRTAEGMSQMTREALEDELFPMCKAEEVAVTAYSALGAGFFTGKYMSMDRTKIPRGTRMDVAPAHADLYFNEANFKILGHLRQKSAETGISIAELAMAWAMTHPAVTAIIIGARTPAQVDQAISAYNRGMDPELRAEMASW